MLLCPFDLLQGCVFCGPKRPALSVLRYGVVKIYQRRASQGRRYFQPSLKGSDAADDNLLTFNITTGSASWQAVAKNKYYFRKFGK